MHRISRKSRNVLSTIMFYRYFLNKSIQIVKQSEQVIFSTLEIYVTLGIIESEM